jgi:CBS domain-containing protein
MSKKPLHKTVGELMSTVLVSLREVDRVSTAAREMTLSAIRHLPVVDEKGHLVGLVSNADIVAALSQKNDPEIGTIMARDLYTVKRDSPAERAAATMIDQKLNALPVIGVGGELIGIITATDFLVVAYQALTGAPIERVADEM